ncbi:hypothetical protein [Paenibacillus brasilensis]|uniref:Uncharacterized protein n=1 Tax=Paenibacillus brasilensis TaxID=128574 RepID=A0ABU0L626_9BACL|nr:hypothetical protein [Paenibacillus brasilensis]MDQ0496746.1 hypothetical protein [Paenibacillus brasilensis]
MNQVIQQLANKKINSLLPLPEYFTNDIWESNAMAEILHLKHFPNYNRNFRFDMIENPNFREEVKRYFYTNLINGRWSLQRWLVKLIPLFSSSVSSYRIFILKQ